LTQAAVGCSVVAFGTSLPELSTTLIAAFNKTSDVALGNVIGSNVFNILLIMGLTSALVEIPVPDSFLSLDLWVMLGVAGLLTLFVVQRRSLPDSFLSLDLWVMLGVAGLLTLFVVQRRSLGRAWGAVFLGGYVAYLVVIL
jgi:Ca2+/Na+ antiporter